MPFGLRLRLHGQLLPVCLTVCLLHGCDDAGDSRPDALDANANGISDALQLPPRDAAADAEMWDAPLGDTLAACDNGARLAREAAVVPCSTTAVTTKVYTNRALFEAALSNKTNVINFDCIPSSGDDVVPIASDAFLVSHGATVMGKGELAGQYVSRSFTFPVDFAPSSPPNVFAPGPRMTATAPSRKPTTHVAFPLGSADGCVAGFGAVFIDVDFAAQAASSLSVANQAGTVLSSVILPNAPSGQGQFRGVIAFDTNGKPTPVIAGVDIVTGNIFATEPVGEGVVLDDFVFGSEGLGD